MRQLHDDVEDCVYGQVGHYYDQEVGGGVVIRVTEQLGEDEDDMTNIVNEKDQKET